jgi:hypothetical protein
MSSRKIADAKAARKTWTAYNAIDGTALIKFGIGASATSFTVKLRPEAFLEMDKPIYTGRIDAIWEEESTGKLVTTEW